MPPSTAQRTQTLMASEVGRYIKGYKCPTELWRTWFSNKWLFQGKHSQEEEKLGSLYKKTCSNIKKERKKKKKQRAH